MVRVLRWMSLCATIVVLAGLSLSGCGGGGDDTATTVAPPVTAAPGGGAAAPVAPSAAAVPVAVLQATENTPADVKSALEQNKPLVLMFYSPGGSDDTKVLQSLTKLTPRFPTAFISQYDYKAPDTYGDLGQVLQVGNLPSVVLIDASANVTQVFTGFVDEGTLNQSMVNLTR
jgi:hypothetical protein